MHQYRTEQLRTLDKAQARTTLLFAEEQQEFAMKSSKTPRSVQVRHESCSYIIYSASRITFRLGPIQTTVDAQTRRLGKQNPPGAHHNNARHRRQTVVGMGQCKNSVAVSH